jgi:hypothetical protein
LGRRSGSSEAGCYALRADAHAPDAQKTTSELLQRLEYRTAASEVAGLRVNRELVPMKKEQVDVANAVVWIPDSTTPNGIAEVPLTDVALEALKAQMGSRGQQGRMCSRVQGSSTATR